MLSMTTSGWVKATSTWEAEWATLNSQWAAVTMATSSRSSAASTAWQTCWPMRPRAPSTPTRMGSVIRAPPSDRAVEVVLAERADDGEAARATQHPLGRGGHVGHGDGVDPAQQFVDAEHVAVGDLALADPGH